MLYSCPFNLNRPANRVLWEITGKCNMSCKHCLYYVGSYAKRPDITLERVLEIVSQMQQDGTIDEVWLSGGEPLMRTDLFEIISSIHKAGMKPSVSTNGFLVTQDLAFRLKENGVNYVHLSIDGIDPEEHDSFRRKNGAFEHVVRAADYLKMADITVGATSIVTRENVEDLESLVLLALTHGIKVLSFYMVEPLGRGKILKGALDIDLMEEISAQYEQLVVKYGALIHLELFRTTDSKTILLSECKCYNFYTITNDGVLGGCPWLMKSEHNPVEISLDSLPFHLARAEVQRELQTFVNERIKSLAGCEKCKKASRCGKGCPAVSNTQLEDPLCGYVRDENTSGME